MPYTIMGGEKSDRIRKYRYPVSVLLINRKGRFYREGIIEEFVNSNSGEIICVKAPGEAYDVESLHGKFPEVKFLLLQSEISIGEKLNIGIDEAKSKFVLVLWDDMKIQLIGQLNGIIEEADSSGILCIVPVLKNKKMETIPSIQVPGFLDKELKVTNWLPEKENALTIYPFDYTGIYNKEKFIISGGFDYNITNPYWQKMDFGFRAYMWGETIACRKNFIVQYIGDINSEDSTPDESYKYFYLKNMAVRFKRDRGVLPFSQFIKFMFHSDTGPLYAYQEFKQVKDWIRINRYRFKQDAVRVIDLWDVEE